jgi:methylmalonyl-CoA/ethylmalonyl-CoA epimerase
MITRVDHVGIYVDDLDAAVRFWRDVVGLECTEISAHAESELRLAHVCVNGVELELIEAPVEKTMLRHMPYRGAGIYHVGLRTDDLEGEAARLEAAGLELLDETPRTGDGMRIQFTAPAGLAQGVMIELVDRVLPGPADRKVRSAGEESPGPADRKARSAGEELTGPADGRRKST